jgi:RNA polymerase sigma-70 factor (ECF subfamily)
LEDNKSLSDIELMAKITGNNTNAFEELYDRYSTILYTLIRKIVVDKSIAQEVLADLFITIWLKKDHLNIPGKNVFTWLVTFTRNKAVDRKRREESITVYPEYTDEFEEQFIIPKLSNAIEPLDLSTASSAKQKFEEALGKLTDAQKFVLYLAYYEGKTQSKIAAQLNIPVPTVKSKIQLSLSKLQQNLVSG